MHLRKILQLSKECHWTLATLLPSVASTMMSSEFDSICHGVLLALLQKHLEPQSGLALVVFAILHVLEQLKRF